ncbi:MAG: adenine phosphoribosyltransferase, partial [Planctomycetota bacterium]|nr:adenine phosphoribosyltransferase [Planctomycetota bacterium]
PRKGILFRDITPILKDHALLERVVQGIGEQYKDKGIQGIAAIESRGFIFGVPLALQMRVPFLPIRKSGKLPCKTRYAEYKLEYGTDRVEMHEDAVAPKQKILIVDDLLATGGTAAASATLVESVGGVVAGCAFVVELGFLRGRENLRKYDLFSLVTYEK